MTRKVTFLLFIMIVFCWDTSPQDEFLKVESQVNPKVIAQGEEGLLKIKIITKNGIRIYSHPEFIIKLDENSNLIFSKQFFTGSELNFLTIQEKGEIFLDLEKEIEIPFKLNENALIGKHVLAGEIVFTALFQDNWSVKTYQRFNASFTSRKSQKIKRK